MPQPARSNSDEALARALLRVRIAQLMVNEQLKAKALRVPVHLALGHEAIAVAVSAAMAPADCLLLTHRNIHYNIARAGSFRDEYHELLLRPDGIGGGMLGSMNMANPSAGVLYTSSILGNCLAVAAGAALASRVLADDSVVIAVTGDGAIEEGTFYESLLFARTYALPLLFVVENNEWSMATRIEERRCPLDLAKLGASVGATHHALAGNDVYTYAEVVAGLRRRITIERTPAILEVALTTLGDWMMPVPDRPGGKFINYHHGPAPTVAIGDSPLIRANTEDPVHVLGQRLTEGRVADLGREIVGQLERELA